MPGIINEIYSLDAPSTMPAITVGKVVNTNDPQQMGRVQVFIPNLGHNGTTDNHTTDVGQHYFWVSYASPMAGADSTQLRGPGDGESTDGVVSYGMWSIPKIGADVLIAIVDGDHRNMYWFACLYNYGTPHTLPHGRYMAEGGSIDGPLSSKETPITPLYANLSKAFNSDKSAPEWVSRGADYSVSAVSQRQISYANHPVTSSVPDNYKSDVSEADKQKAGRDEQYTQGYAKNRLNPDKNTANEDYTRKGNDTQSNLESTVHSITSPGGHAWAMDDRAENNRFRFRTSTGHQIIMDDTNERIYVSTNEGRNYIEMDSDGHIYIYSQESCSVRSEGDINFTTEKTFRVKAKEGIHLQTDDEYRLHATKDIHVHGNANKFETIDGNRDVYILGTDKLLAGGDIHIHTKANAFILTDADFHLHSANIHTKSDGSIASESASATTIKSSNINVDSGGNIANTGGLHASGGDVVSDTISLNNHTHKYDQHVSGVGPVPSVSQVPSGGGSVSSSPPAWGGTNATNATPSKDAYWTNITPHHEPWPRTFNGLKAKKELYTVTPEYPATSPKVAQDNKQTPANDHVRGKLWHR